MDVAVCQLRADVEYNPSFPARLGLPAIAGIGEPKRGDRVFKVGGWSGLTHGTVISVSATFGLPSRGNPIWMKNMFVIEGDRTSDVERREFSREGDSGAVVGATDAAGNAVLLGMIVGNDGRRTYAFPIRPALEALGCILLVPH